MGRQKEKNSGIPGTPDADITGEPGIHQVEVKPGLKLSLVDFQPTEPRKISFETQDAPLEFSFHLSGCADYAIVHPQGKNNFQGKSGLNVISSFPQSRGTMELSPRAPVRMLAIHMAPCFFNQYMSEQYISEQSPRQLPELEEMVQSGDFSYYFRPGRMSASMAVAAAQLFGCPYQGIARQWFYESKTLELMVLQFSQLSDFFRQADTQTQLNGQELAHIQKAQDLLCRDLENPPSLFQLARSVGMSHTKLNRGFKILYGTTVFGYLRRYRLEQSRLLLDAANMNISEIAYASGFSSPSHFAKAFLACFGVQPSIYLKEVLQRRVISSV